MANLLVMQQRGMKRKIEAKCGPHAAG